MKSKTAALLFLPALLLLGACSSMKGWFTEGDDLPPLKGERISILQLQKELAPSEAAQQTPVALPAAWANVFWPQPGGYPSHAMGHLALGGNLKEAWSASIGDGGDRRDPLISQPIVADGMVFTIDTEGSVTAFGTKNGARKWRSSSVDKGTERTGGIGGGIAYASGRLYVTNGYSQLTCFDAKTGKRIWRTPLPAPSQSAPTVIDDRVYLITLDNRLMVYSSIDGAALWSYAGVVETTGLLGSVSPAVDGSIAVLPQSSGEIFGLRVTDGQVLWQDNISTISHTGTLSSIADIRGLPVIDQGLVFASSYSGRMVALDKTSGQRVWQREIGSAQMPWAAGDVFVITAEEQIVSLMRESGEIRWVSSLPRYDEDDKDEPIVWSGPVLAGGRLLAASSGGTLAEINPESGKIIRTTELPGPVFIPPVVADNTLFILTQTGELVAYR
jgi:outer membrane protein assembly factor BamB